MRYVYISDVMIQQESKQIIIVILLRLMFVLNSRGRWALFYKKDESIISYSFATALKIKGHCLFKWMKYNPVMYFLTL